MDPDGARRLVAAILKVAVEDDDTVWLNSARGRLYLEHLGHDPDAFNEQMKRRILIDGEWRMRTECAYCHNTGRVMVVNRVTWRVTEAACTMCHPDEEQRFKSSRRRTG